MGTGEAVPLPGERGPPDADAPFTLGWVAGIVLRERPSLRDIGLASLTLSFLTIFPRLLVMTVVDKVLTHRSYARRSGMRALPRPERRGSRSGSWRTGRRQSSHAGSHRND
jgi:hypothetical protein